MIFPTVTHYKLWVSDHNMSNDFSVVWKTKPKLVSKVGSRSWGWPEGSLFDSYYTKVLGECYSFPCSTLPLIYTLLCWELSKKVSSYIFWVLGLNPSLPGYWQALYSMILMVWACCEVTKLPTGHCAKSLYMWCIQL